MLTSGNSTKQGEIELNAPVNLDFKNSFYLLLVFLGIKFPKRKSTKSLKSEAVHEFFMLI